jgi:hypothetical protein
MAMMTMTPAGGKMMIALGPIVLLVVGLVVVFMLLANPRTRKGTLIGLGCLLGLVVLGVFWGYQSKPRPTVQTANTTITHSDGRVERRVTYSDGRDENRVTYPDGHVDYRVTAGPPSNLPAGEMASNTHGPAPQEAMSPEGPHPAAHGEYSTGNSMLSWGALLLIIGVGMVLFKLLANPRTRTATLVIGGLSLPMLLVAGFFFLRVVSVRSGPSQPAVADRTAATQPPRIGNAPMQLRSDDPRMETVPSVPLTAEATEPGEPGRDIAVNSAPPTPPAPQPPQLWSALFQAITGGQAAAKQPESPPKPKRPDWAGASPGWIDNRDPNTYMMPIAVGPYTSLQDCDSRLDDQLQNALLRYAGRLTGNPTIRISGIVSSPEELRRQLIKGSWEEWMPTSLGAEIPLGDTANFQDRAGMKVRLHVLVGFDPRMQEQIREVVRYQTAAWRVWGAGVGLGGVLAFLAVVFGYLKLDEATGGRYRRRLRVASVLAILVAGLLVAGLLS